MSFEAIPRQTNDDIAIQARKLTKIFPIYARPIDRLKQAVLPRLRRLLGRPHKDYCTTFTALDGISFEIRKGETVGILGHNGAGKSTLLQLLCGTLSPTSGEIIVNGRVAALLELGAGFNGEYTGRENVYMNAHILGMSQEEIDTRFDDIARFADIGDFIERPVKSYSSGMYARLAFAVAICVDPDILIIDEALAVGDAKFQNKCFNRLKELKKSGTTILFVSHAIEQVRLICDNGIVLNRGKMLFSGTAVDATVKYLSIVHDEMPAFDADTIRASRGHEFAAAGWNKLVATSEEMRVFGSGGAWLNGYKFEHITSPNTVFGGQRISLACDFSWSSDAMVQLIEAEGYDSNITAGFTLSAANGLYLFGCNGFDSSLNIDCLSKQRAVVEFEFLVPLLKSGDYFLTLAIALGSQGKHKQLQWYENLFQLKLIERQNKALGMFAIDYKMTELTITEHTYEQTSTKSIQ